MPLVSAIIAVYNGEGYIARAIDSVFAQTFKTDEVELIVIDDASQDSTPKILKGYADRARIVTKKKNHGLAAARNLAAALAKGDYVAFLDADDIWFPERLTKTVSALQDTPTATMAFSDVVPVNESDLPMAPSYIHPSMARGPGMEDLLREGWWPILPSTVLIHRWAFNRVGGFTEKFRGAAGFEDTELWFSLRELGEFAFVPESLVMYRLSPLVARMRKYAPGFALFADRLRKQYGEQGDQTINRSSALYRWLLTLKGLRCLEAGDMPQAREALSCVLRYQKDLRPLRLRDQIRMLLANGDSAARTNGDVSTDDVRRALYSRLPQRLAIARMQREGLFEPPPPPPGYEDFAEELFTGKLPLALY